MSLSNGNPVFTTVGGDASLATVTYKQEGSTSQVTSTLSSIATDVAENTSSITNINNSASEAQTNASTALSAANTATTIATGAAKTANSAIPSASLGQPSGPVAFDGSSNVTIPGSLTVQYSNVSIATDSGLSALVGIGPRGLSNQWQRLGFYSGSSTDTSTWFDASFTAMGGTGNSDGTLNIDAKGGINPGSDNTTTLGSASNRFAGINLGSSPSVTSDATVKTVIGTLGDSSYADSAKLFAACSQIKPKVFTYSGGTRSHIGYLAQDVEAAFTAQGLDAADFGLWCNSPITTIAEKDTTIGINTKQSDGSMKVVDTTFKAGSQIPTVDASGNPTYLQSLRYDELNTLMISYAIQGVK